MLALVVAGDGDVDVARGRVHVGEGDHRDVGVRALGHRLVVGARVGHDEQAGLAEGGLQVDGIQVYQVLCLCHKKQSLQINQERMNGPGNDSAEHTAPEAEGSLILVSNQNSSRR